MPGLNVREFEKFDDEESEIIVIEQKLLTQLRGLSQSSAERLVVESGHECRVLPTDTITTAIAIANTIILWMNEDVVVLATAGDPFEVNDEQL